MRYPQTQHITPLSTAIEEAFKGRNRRRGAVLSQNPGVEEVSPPNLDTLPVAIHIDRVLSDAPKKTFH